MDVRKTELVARSFEAALKEYEDEWPSTNWHLVQDFAEIGQDVQAYIRNVWPELALYQMANLAVELLQDVELSSPIEKMMYFALRKEFARDFLGWPHHITLSSNQRLSMLSFILDEKETEAIYKKGDIDYEIDLFLHLNTNLINANGKRLSYPFYLAIECDGHDYHERTKEQARKDRAKDRTLKEKGLTTIRFTGSEITKSPDACAKQVRSIVDAELALIQKRLSG